MTGLPGETELPCAVDTSVSVANFTALSDPNAQCRLILKKGVAWLTPDQLDSFIDLLIGIRSEIHKKS